MRTNKSNLELRFEKKDGTDRARSWLFSHLSASLLALLFVFSLNQFGLDGVKGWLLDLVYRTQWWNDADPSIALIAYDDASSRRYEGSHKIPAEEIAQVMTTLAEEKPRAVVLIGSINERSYNDAELRLIAKSLQKVSHSYIGYIDDESLGKRAPTALGDTAYLPGYVSRDSFSYGADSVSRRVMITIAGVPTVYSQFIPLDPQTGEASLASGSHAYERSGDTLQSYIHWQGRAGTYKPVSSLAVAEQHFPRHSLRDKIVLFGSVLNSRRGQDHIFTPYSRQMFHTPYLEGAAQSLVTLRRDNGLVRTGAVFQNIVSILIALLTVNMVLFLSPRPRDSICRRRARIALRYGLGRTIRVSSLDRSCAPTAHRLRRLLLSDSLPAGGGIPEALALSGKKRIDGRAGATEK